MIKYICKHCGGLECETSVCPVCKGRAFASSVSINYCRHCNIPVFDDVCPLCGEKATYIASDIRPVFPEERLLVEILLNKPMAFVNDSVWASLSGTYFVNGGKIPLTLSSASLSADSSLIIEQLTKYHDANLPFVNGYLDSVLIQRFVKANQPRLGYITDEAINYIRNRSQQFNPSSMFVSFSGGKDSTVTSDLVMRALENESIIHVYGDTTLEYPSTHEYVERFRKKHPRTPVIIAKNPEHNFNDLCAKIGPPSRVMRWCCTIFKTGAITKIIENLFAGVPKVLTFFGLRRFESKSRSNYERDSEQSKISKQTVASPIIDWTTFDTWLYMIANNVDFNDAYRLGFSRVGCWCCPNNSRSSDFLSSIYMPFEHAEFYEILYEFAKKAGKPDWKVYIDDGSWKARQGGNAVAMGKNTIVSFKPCVFDEKAFNFELNRPIDDFLYMLFQPFGTLDFEMGNPALGEVYVLEKTTGQPILQLRGPKGTKTLRVALLTDRGRFKSLLKAEQLITDQITKFQTCIACGACQSVCPVGAILVKMKKAGDVSVDNVDYRINMSTCVHCLKCVDHFDSGCYMKKVLRIKNGK